MIIKANAIPDKTIPSIIAKVLPRFLFFNIILRRRAAQTATNENINNPCIANVIPSNAICKLAEFLVVSINCGRNAKKTIIL